MYRPIPWHLDLAIVQFHNFWTIIRLLAYFNAKLCVPELVAVLSGLSVAFCMLLTTSLNISNAKQKYKDQILHGDNEKQLTFIRIDTPF